MQRYKGRVKSFFVAGKKFQKSCFLSDFSRNKALKSLFSAFFTAFACVFMYTPIHIYMYSRPHEYNEIIYGMGKIHN